MAPFRVIDIYNPLWLPVLLLIWADSYDFQNIARTVVALLLSWWFCKLSVQFKWSELSQRRRFWSSTLKIFATNFLQHKQMVGLLSIPSKSCFHATRPAADVLVKLWVKGHSKIFGEEQNISLISHLLELEAYGLFPAQACFMKGFSDLLLTTDKAEGAIHEYIYKMKCLRITQDPLFPFLWYTCHAAIWGALSEDLSVNVLSSHVMAASHAGFLSPIRCSKWLVRQNSKLQSKNPVYIIPQQAGAKRTKEWIEGRFKVTWNIQQRNL